MENMVNVFLFGKKYEVPASMTIMRAMESAGYQLVRGCGCRNGFCGACATIYRIAGDTELKTCLACQTKVENNMYVATLPFFPLVKQVYDIEKVKPTEAEVLVITDSDDFDGKQDWVLKLPKTGTDTISPFLFGVTVQLIALQMTKIRGIDPDVSNVLNKITVTK